MARAINLQFAGAMISNYRAQYKNKYNKDFRGTDIELLNIINSEPTWSTSEEQDEAIVESMAEF